jgi:hypothetical protein
MKGDLIDTCHSETHTHLQSSQSMDTIKIEQNHNNAILHIYNKAVRTNTYHLKKLITWPQNTYFLLSHLHNKKDTMTFTTKKSHEIKIT